MKPIRLLTCQFDTSQLDVDTARMPTRIKRTYNLSAETVRRVRELSAQYGVADTQDAVVEKAIDRLYTEQREAEEAALWAAAAADPDFKREMMTVAEVMRDGQEW